MLQCATFRDAYEVTTYVYRNKIKREQIQSIVSKGEVIYLFYWMEEA